MKMDLLRVANLRKEFDGILAVDGLSFSLEKGTMTSLIGPNGAGKTTVFNLLMGLVRPDDGHVYFNGKEITRLPTYEIAQLGIGKTFQNIRIFPQISVLENLMLAPRQQKGEAVFSALLRPQWVRIEERKVKEKALSHLDTIGLLDKKDEMAENLSHGQRKLLDLARALAAKPKLLLLDEPIAGVHDDMKKKILNWLRELRDTGKTILFIEHDPEIVLQCSDKVIVMNKGNKVKEGTPEEVKNNPKVIELYPEIQNVSTQR